ncbi:DUF4214 domain-containing protein [Paracraurococcus lichenis]|uniref:Chitooligosaccharide deacetylase n=1 Tax=Paracraurococcus lichenis TaxID=3064888 RepID=A0ABT9E6G3_9PROT|nr:DUF4214 domain-containing protein [Paracraurococcus sp. LOR1-02]MDO9711744.1 DUF4214 domain-containing protein [Paracraurococcus sp. LOR1-02]
MSVVVNGQNELGEWTASTRLDYLGASPSGYALYGIVDHTSDGASFVFCLQSATAIGANTTLWLNTDANAATGYSIFTGLNAGADYNIDFVADANGKVAPYLYTGAAAQNYVAAIGEYAFSSDSKTVEFRVPLTALGLTTAPAKTQVYADVNDAVFLPGDYASMPPLTLLDQATLPAPATTGLRVGIVYSETSAEKFFDKTAYADLFMAAQNQVAMAGVPFDILTESDLTDLSKLASYKTLIFPSFANVPLAKAAAIQQTLETATQTYGVGIITAGNFMTNDETGAALPGNSYASMQMLLGLGREGGANAVAVHVAAAQDVSNPIMAGYTAGETIRDYASIGTQWFTSLTSNSTVLATQTVAGATHEAVIATTTGGRNVHFATEGMLADNNMLAHAVDWSAQPLTGPTLKLEMSRQSAIVASRSDVDEAMQLDEVKPASGPGIYDKMLPILQQWKTDYNFVGSYYIDIGNNTNGTGTNWTVSKPYYQQLLAMGNEIGSHSITHPEDTNLLTPAQLQAEFQTSKAAIQDNLGITVLGAAIPGNPEKIAVSEQVMQYYSYLTGGNTAVGAGYPGAFGYMTPSDTSSVYIAPNISSDFTLVGFQKMTADQASAAWQAEWKAAVSHAELPVVVWPWHDYGLTNFLNDPTQIYNDKMYTDLIKTAYDAGSEFVTLADLAQRIATFDKASLSYSMVDADTMSVTVGSTAASTALGTFALDLEGGSKIKSVSGWYAYNADSIFLPTAGGTFTVDLGATQDDVTHITALPMRAQLVSLTGNGRDLDFSVMGEGLVTIDLAASGSQAVTVTGATVQSLAGEILTLNLGAIGQHTVSVRLPNPPSPAEKVVALSLSADSGASSTDFITNVAAQTVGGTLSAPLAAGDVVQVSLDNGAHWQAATSTAGSTSFTLAGVTLSGSGALQARVMGSLGSASDVLQQPYVLDQAAPTETVAIAAMTKDSGTAGDFLTNDGSAGRTITGTLSAALSADERLQVSSDGGATWVAATVSGTSWSAADAGTHTANWTIQGHVVDLAGNLGPLASTLVTYDSVAPTETVAITGMTKDSGTAGDFVTNDGSAGRTITGTLSAALSADERLQVSSDGGATWVEATVNGTSWSTVDAGAHTANWTIQGHVVDLAGNLGPLASKLVTYDSAIPPETVPTTPPAQGPVDNGGGGANEPTVTPPAQGPVDNGGGGANGPTSAPGLLVNGDDDANTLTGTAGNDTIAGFGGNDTINGGPGNDQVDGGAGLDTLVINAARALSTAVHGTDGAWTVTGPDGIDALTGIERVQFSDGTLALDVDGNAGQAYRLYLAAFNRTPDIAGLQFQTNELDTHLALWQVASNFLASPEFQSLYGTLDAMTDTQFVTSLYSNVLHRAPEAAGLSFHLANLAAGLNRHDLLVQFSESPENQANVLPAIKDGVWLG